jgi:DNA-binding winged helix-turn-helix (wHTH) protein/energy-coupling factor transporter ATP-binding protein EcfA2
VIKHPFYIGQWQATPATNTLRLGELVKQLEPKAMDVLLLLCQRRGDVLSADDIADECWGNAEIGDNPVHKAITQLRKALGDKASSPTYIETIRKRGYRIIAEVDFPLENTQELAQTEWQGGSPFPGLSAFDSSDASVFFGRSEQIATLLQQVSKQVVRQRTFCLILGPSGTGKSSLVNAGVLPKLTASQGYDGNRVISHTHLDFADVTKGRLLLDFAGALLDWDIDGVPVFDGMSADTLASALEADPNEVAKQCHTACTNENDEESGLKHHVFLFIDRLEILLSSPLFSDEERETLLVLIETLATSGSVIIFSACRNDFYPLVVNQPGLMIDKSAGSHFDLTAPTHADLSQMIRLPAGAANLTWSKDEKSGLPLDEILANEASSNPDSLPMLQYTLQELYIQRSESDELQAEVYRTLGGIEGAIGKKAEEVHQQLPTSHQQELAYVLSLLVTLNADGKTITSRAARWSQLQTQSQKDFVQAMVDSRLFVSHLQNDEPCFSVAHEALLRRWPRASEWIATHREGLTIKSRLQEVSARWLAEDKNRAYLLTEGKPLQEALTLKNNTAFTLETQELDLIAASASRAKVKRWSKRAIVTLLCLLTFTSVIMSYKSQQSEYLAQQKRLEAESLLGFMVGEFADKLRSVRRMDLLDGISNKAIEYFSHNSEENSPFIALPFTKTARGFEERFQHAQTLEAMGEVAYSRVKTDEASIAFSEAKSLLEKLLEEQPTHLDLLKVLGANAFWLAQLAMDSANFNEARTLFERYLRYSQLMFELAPSDLDVQWELSYSYMAMGSVNTKLHQHSIAKNAFQSALDIQYKLVENLPKHDISRADIADTLEWLAETQEQLGNLRQAAYSREKVQTILSSLLTAHKNNGDILESLAYSYLNQANILYYLGNHVAASQAISSSILYFNAMLDQDASNHVWKVNLIFANALQGYLVKLNDSKSAVSHISLDDFKKVLNRAEKSSYSLIIIIKSYQINGYWNLAESAISLAKSRLDTLLNKQPTNIELLSSLANVYLTAAKQATHGQLTDSRTNQAFEDKKAKLNACNQAISKLQPIVTVDSSYELLLPYVQAHSCTGKLSQVQELIDKLESMQITQYQF